ncbi:aldehyde dehydrogenase family protein [Haladaptatus sp. AB618]|uniref:aldehyde dehydrogenase family protein n=1 Tax=Haladaptatus sp. AB618 TaxID=2934173 RepID=UPI00209C4CBB|nr:aldehyde dehydrogenase family protein [Haladaptatus sp. AB618]MCO8254856.1 aldehyde dehydrogenase family protein [Haladaptatus sp. AB618]
MHSYEMRIDGQVRDGTERSVENPATGETVGTVSTGTRTDANDAVEAARSVRKEWAESDPARRERGLRAVAERIEADRDELSELLVAETGKCLGTAEGEVMETAQQFRFFAGVVDKVRGDTIPTSTNRLNYTKRVPYGVTAHIIPWNYPLLLGSRGIAAALATGNTVVAKPPSRAPLSTMWYGNILVEEFPDGVVNLVPGSGREVGAALSDHPGVDLITFTGSTAVGQQVLEAAAANITPVDLELGGKAPAVVLPDTDVENAARGVARGIFSNAGQNCVATSRAIVHEDVKVEFTELVVREAERISLGPGGDPSTDMGPVISAGAQDDILGYIEAGREEGATLRTGGNVPDDPELQDGYFVEPTVFDDVTPDMQIAREEIFGPVLSILRVESVDEAVAVANDSPYALAASVWTDGLHATRIADRLDHGLVAVNTFPVSMPQSPWGGNKESGLGREGGYEGVEAFTTVNSVVVEHGEMEPY